MKIPSFLSAAALAIGIALGAAGCASQPTIAGSHVAGSRAPRTFALAVSLPDGSQVTPQQWAVVKAAFQQQLAAAGYTLVDDLSLADRIIRVVFTPAEDDPTNGNAMVLSVRPNPVYAFNSGPAFAPGFASMSGYNSAFYGYNNFGYNDPAYYSGGSSTIAPRIDPPSHGRPNNPVDCPPGNTDQASNHHRGGDGDSNGSHRSWPSDGGSSHSSSRSSRSDSGSSPSYSGSSGSSSYSGGSSSSSSDFSSSSSSGSSGFSGSSGSSGSSYTPSTSTNDAGSTSRNAN